MNGKVGRVCGTRSGALGDRRQGMTTSAEGCMNEGAEVLESPEPQVTVHSAKKAAEGEGKVVG